MPEYPIVIGEYLDTYTWDPGSSREVRYGWKLAMHDDNILQATIHQMDTRPGHTRLLNDHIDYTNISIERLVEAGPYNHWSNVFNREFYDSDNRLYHWRYRVIHQDDFITAWEEFIAESEILETCEHCNEVQLATRPHTEHEDCHSCGDTIVRDQMMTYEVLDQAESTFDDAEHVTVYVCAPCANSEGVTGSGDIFTCENCGTYAFEPVVTRMNFAHMGEVMICDPCANNAEWCQSNDHWVPVNSMHDIDEEICSTCWRNQNNPQRWIQSWNFRPDLEFFPEIPTDPERPLYIGIELEMTWPGWRNAHQERSNAWLKELTEEHDMLYVKSDSSVSDGFEVVTHPMEPKWAMDNFPFEFFERAIELGAKATHESTGTHIHIAKAALTTAQMYKIMSLHLKLKTFCGIVGGRGTGNTYASWDQTDTIAANLKEIARKKGEAFGDGARYVPVNVRNEETLELRYMAGSIEPEQIKKNIEWVQALYDFTDYISIEDIKQGVLDNQSYLLGWALNGEYPSLADFLTQKVMVPQTMPARSI